MNTYEGEMKHGTKHTTGNMNFAASDWDQDKRRCHGVCTYADGSRYEGELKDGQRHGKGTLTWSPELNGKSDTYTGDWVANKMTGHGVYTYADGRHYERSCSQITSVCNVNY